MQLAGCWAHGAWHRRITPPPSHPFPPVYCQPPSNNHWCSGHRHNRLVEGDYTSLLSHKFTIKVRVSGQKRVMGTGFRETPSLHYRTCSFCPASLNESFKCSPPSVWIWKGMDLNAGRRIRRENYSKAQRLDPSISNCLDCWTLGTAIPSEGAIFFLSVTDIINCARAKGRIMTWLAPVALLSESDPLMLPSFPIKCQDYTETHEPCFNSTNMKKADISFPFRKGIQIPDVQHESSTLHLLASMKIKTVEKSKQLIGAAVWRLDLTGWWRRGQLHLVITYLFSLISSAFTSYVWKQRNVKGWYEKKTFGSLLSWEVLYSDKIPYRIMFIRGLTAEKNIPSISIDFGKGWTYLFLSCFFQGVWPKLSPWQLTPF